MEDPERYGHGILMWLWYFAMQRVTDVYSSLADSLCYGNKQTKKEMKKNPNHQKSMKPCPRIFSYLRCSGFKFYISSKRLIMLLKHSHARSILIECLLLSAVNKSQVSIYCLTKESHNNIAYINCAFEIKCY